MVAKSTAKRAGRILVVEDDPDLLESVQDLLEDEGYAVETAKDGLEALQKLSTLPVPHLVLLDLLLPDVSGWEILKSMSAQPSLASVKVAAFTADNKAQPEGVVATLRKPFELSELIDLLAKHCC